MLQDNDWLEQIKNGVPIKIPVSDEKVKLTGVLAWEQFKKDAFDLHKEAYDTAVFLHCALKKNSGVINH